MSSLKQEKKKGKTFGIFRIFNSIKYSIHGLKYAYTNEQSLSLHGLSTLLIIAVGIILQIGFMDWVVVILSSVIVLSIELINTAIEATVDMVTQEYNEYAKIAKDCGSAAAGVAGVAYAVIVGFIFIGRLIELWG